MSIQKTADESEFEVRVDNSSNDIESGEVDTRTLVMEVPTVGTNRRARKAHFKYHPERETYQLEEYRQAEYSFGNWKNRSGTFKQRDVDVLNYLAEHIKRTADSPVDVELFVGEDS